MNPQTLTRRPQTGLAPVDESTALAIQQANETAMAAFGSGSSGNIIAALQVAESMESLRKLFDEAGIKGRILALQDTSIGFRTDRDPKQKRRGSQEFNTPYPYDVVKDCAIEAGLRGLQLVGNQWNIISSRTYCTKEGFEFLIRGLKHVTDFRVNLGVPANKPGGVIIECEASWNNQGKAQSLKSSIPVKSDDYSSADQLLGKATRKFLKRCYEQMTGNVLPEGEAGEHVDQIGYAEKAALQEPRVAFQQPTAKTEVKVETSTETADPGPDNTIRSVQFARPEKTEKKVEPATPAATTAATDSAQAQLEAIITSAGLTLDDYNRWAIDQQETPMEFPSWGDVPAMIASRHVKAKTGLVRMVGALKGGAQ